MNEKLQQTPQSPESVRHRIDELLTKVMDQIDILDFHEKMIVLAQRIRERYPDYIKYRPYHRLIGSTPKEGPDLVEGDFEGDCSVVAFLQGLLDREKGGSV